MVASLKDMVAVLAGADPKLKAEVYADLGIELTYHPANRRVVVEARPERAFGTVRVGGGT